MSLLTPGNLLLNSCFSSRNCSFIFVASLNLKRGGVGEANIERTQATKQIPVSATMQLRCTGGPAVEVCAGTL